MDRRGADRRRRHAGVPHLSPARGARYAAAAVALVAAPFCLWALGVPALDDPGEGMHAEIAHELATSRDPFALTLSGARYVDKPPLLYVLIASAYTVLGRSELAARLPSALAAIVAVAATAWLGARLGGRWCGMLAGLALLGSVGFFAYARYVRPEALLVAALATGFALVLVGWREQRRRLAAAGILVFGIAGLAKDPLAALLPPVAIAIAFVLAGGARPVHRWLPLPAALGGLTIAVGWWIIVEIRTPGFVRYTVVDNHVLNVLRARQFPDEDVPLSALAFLAVAIAAAVPWSLTAVVGFVDLVRRRAWRQPTEAPWVALALWAIGVIAVTMASSFRLPHYGLPAYPMLALLAARAWRAPTARWLAAAHAVFFTVVGVAASGVWASGGEWGMARVIDAADVATRKSAHAGQAAPVPGWEVFQPLVGGTAVIFLVTALALLVVRRWWTVDDRAPALVVAAGMLAVLPLVGVALARVSDHRAVKALAVEIQRGWKHGDVLVHEGPLENSGALEWYAGRRPVMVDGRHSVLGFGATLDGAASRFWEPERLERAWHSEHVWLVTTRSPDRSVVQHLPGPRVVAATGGHWLYVNRER